MHTDIDRVLLSEDQIRTALSAVAAEITAAYRGRDFTVVGVLKGSCVFVADLIRCIPLPIELSFVGAASYRDATRAGALELSFFPEVGEVAGRELLLVDDILDTGRTMTALSSELVERGAVSVRTCVLLDKPARREVAFEADYRCFEIEDHFVVGYGLDYAGRYRNLPYVGTLRPEALGVRAEGEG